MDCKIIKDCKEINMIVSVRTQFRRITRKSTINANSDCNRRQIGLRKDCETGTDCQVIEGLHQDPCMSTNCNRNSVQSRGLQWDCRLNEIPLQSYRLSTNAFGNPIAIAIQSNPDCNQLNQNRLRLDCKTTKDCYVIDQSQLEHQNRNTIHNTPTIQVQSRNLPAIAGQTARHL